MILNWWDLQQLSTTRHFFQAQTVICFPGPRFHDSKPSIHIIPGFLLDLCFCVQDLIVEMLYSDQMAIQRKQFVHQMIARCVCSTKATAVLLGSKQLSARSLDTFREHVQIQSAYPERWDYKFFQELHWQNSTSSLQTGLKQNTVDHLHKPSVPYVAYVWLMDAGTQQHKTETHNKQKNYSKESWICWSTNDAEVMWLVCCSSNDGRPWFGSLKPTFCKVWHA